MANTHFKFYNLTMSTKDFLLFGMVFVVATNSGCLCCNLQTNEKDIVILLLSIHLSIFGHLTSYDSLTQNDIMAQKAKSLYYPVLQELSAKMLLQFYI